ncbi:MAG: CoA transferase [Dehalococcoidia bacterium]|nr:CoA transferase [Dehalococcoidia bacterium]
MAETALDGVKVLECCQMISGPYCGKLLADLGADVIKVEEPPAGDAARTRGPFPGDAPHPEKSGLFLYLNTNKLGITLNLGTASGRQVFQRLAEQADVLIEDRPPGEMAKIGLDYASLSAINPRLIVTSITPFGQTGPYRDYKSYHLNLYHASGHSSFFYVAPRDRQEGSLVVAGGEVGDYDGGLSAAVATLAALFARLATGQGQHIDISKFEALLSLERVVVARFANTPDPPPWPGMVGGLMPCKDGHVVVTAVQSHQWQALTELMGNPAWAQDEKCRDEPTRAQHRDELQPLLEEWSVQHDKDELYHKGQALGVPIGPVRTVAEIMHWPQARQRGFFAHLDHPQAGRLEYPTAAYRMSETPWRVERAAPLLGEHNEQVYCGRLGYSPEQLAGMAADGTI